MEDAAFVPDETLLAAADNGRGEAFGVLFDRHRDRVFRHVLRLTNVPSDAEDLVALVFVEAWKKRETIRIVEGSILPWLLVTANNVARNQARARRRYNAFLAGVPAPADEPDHADAVHDRLDGQRRDYVLRSAFDRLSDRDREVLTLCVLEELTESEAAAALGVPIGTVKSRLSRARSRLSKSLRSDLSLDLLRSTL